jgi:hypothetical protein
MCVALLFFLHFVYSLKHLILRTVYGFFGDYNQFYCDDGEILKVYSYRFDFERVYHKFGYYLLKPSESDKEGFTIINYLLD